MGFVNKKIRALLFNNKVVDESKSLQDVGIRNGSFVSVVISDTVFFLLISELDNTA